MTISMERPEPPAAEPAHDRWESALWSGLIPGLGQIRNGELALGLVWLAGCVLCFMLALASAFFPQVPIAIGLVAGVTMIALQLLSIVQAFQRARAAGGDAQPPSAFKSAFLTRFVPGLGQLWERRIRAGVLTLVALVLTGLLDETIAALASIIVMILSFCDALLRSRRRTPSPARARSMILAAALLIALATLAPIGLRSSVIRAFRMPSESMHPTLRRGDIFFVDRTRAGRAAAGDLIAHRYPKSPSQVFVKRCVAVGGQTVEIRGKQLFVDGQPVAEPYVIHTDPEVLRFEPRDNFGPFVIPPGEVFVMGDNRDNSNDSRFWGPLPDDDILGRVTKIYWPPDRWGTIPR